MLLALGLALLAQTLVRPPQIRDPDQVNLGQPGGTLVGYDQLMQDTFVAPPGFFGGWCDGCTCWPVFYGVTIPGQAQRNIASYECAVN